MNSVFIEVKWTAQFDIIRGKQIELATFLEEFWLVVHNEAKNPSIPSV